MFEILHISLTLELMVPYVKECKSIDRQPTCNGYWEWCSEIENPHYHCMQLAGLTQLHALMMLRSGKLHIFIHHHFDCSDFYTKIKEAYPTYSVKSDVYLLSGIVLASGKSQFCSVGSQGRVV